MILFRRKQTYVRDISEMVDTHVRLLLLEVMVLWS